LHNKLLQNTNQIRKKIRDKLSDRTDTREWRFRKRLEKEKGNDLARMDWREMREKIKDG